MHAKVEAEAHADLLARLERVRARLGAPRVEQLVERVDVDLVAVAAVAVKADEEHVDVQGDRQALAGPLDKLARGRGGARARVLAAAAAAARRRAGADGVARGGGGPRRRQQRQWQQQQQRGEQRQHHWPRLCRCAAALPPPLLHCAGRALSPR